MLQNGSQGRTESIACLCLSLLLVGCQKEEVFTKGSPINHPYLVPIDGKTAVYGEDWKNDQLDEISYENERDTSEHVLSQDYEEPVERLSDKADRLVAERVNLIGDTRYEPGRHNELRSIAGEDRPLLWEGREEFSLIGRDRPEFSPLDLRRDFER